MRRFLFAAALGAAALAAPAFACDAPPPHLSVSDAELVARSPRVALVEIVEEGAAPDEGGLVGREEDRVRAWLTPFRARVVEDLYGDGPAEITVYGDPFFEPEELNAGPEPVTFESPAYQSYLAGVLTDFAGHEDAVFTELEGYGGAAQGADCLAHPTFVVGERYLVFEGPQHQRGYELIRREDDDAWLVRVRALIAAAAEN